MVDNKLMLLASTSGMIITVVIAIIVGSIVLDDIQEKDSTTTTVQNEVVTISSLPIRLENRFIDNSSFSAINVSTDGNNATIPANDYALETESGLLRTFNNTDWGPNIYVNYTHKVENDFFNTTRSGLDGLTEYNNMGTTIATVAAASIVLALLSGLVFIFKRRR
jgi:hypothetical protein|tara:strand:+ start:737 stop:1231 length:495 start_codon:yes stop_codon:yes gene_type:complete